MDANKLGMFGNSIGAFATIATCMRTDKIKAAAVTAGGLRGRGLDTAENVAKITAPFLIVHGRTDTIVKVELAKNFREALFLRASPRVERIRYWSAHSEMVSSGSGRVPAAAAAP